MAAVDDAKLLALGYGMTDPDDDWSSGPRKQLAVTRVDPDEEWHLLEEFEGMLAVRSLRGDTCFGDSGSPLLVLGDDGEAHIAGVLHGSVSESEVDCGANNISLYAPLSPSLAFLNNR